MERLKQALGVTATTGSITLPFSFNSDIQILCVFEIITRVLTNAYVSKIHNNMRRFLPSLTFTNIASKYGTIF